LTPACCADEYSAYPPATTSTATATIRELFM
jgi:hypothetical protein